MINGIILFAHGSRVEEANAAVSAVAAQLAQDVSHGVVIPAFLELAEPDLPKAVEDLVSRGVQRIVVIPYFLTLGIHLQRDLPRIVEDIQRIHPSVSMHVTAPLDGHPALRQIVADRAQEALA